MDKYIKGFGVYVGEFNEEEIKAGKDRSLVKAAKDRNSLDYINVELIKDNHSVVGMKLWVCKREDLRI